MSNKFNKRSSNGRFKNIQIHIFEHPSLNKHNNDETGSEVPLRNRRNGKPDTVKTVTVRPSMVNLRLVTNEVINKEKQTTTIERVLDWPSQLNRQQQNSILKMSCGVGDETVQSLLDEIQNTSKVVRNPVAYFHGLLSKYKSGDYIPSGAISESDRRDRSRRVEQRMEATRRESIRRGQELFDTYAKASQNE